MPWRRGDGRELCRRLRGGIKRSRRRGVLQESPKWQGGGCASDGRSERGTGDTVRGGCNGLGRGERQAQKLYGRY